MDETVNNAFDEITQAYIAKLKDETADTSIVENFFKDISKKVKSFATDTGSKKTTSIKEEFKGAQIEVLRDNAYVTEYRRFQDKISPKSNLKSLFTLPFLSPEKSEEKDEEVSNTDTKEKDNALIRFIKSFSFEEKAQPEQTNIKPVEPQQINVVETNNEIEEEGSDEMEAGRRKIFDTPKEFLLDGITPNGASSLAKVLTPILVEMMDPVEAALREGMGKNEPAEDKDDDQSGLQKLIGNLMSIGGGLKTAGSILTRALPLVAKVAAPLAVIAAGNFIGGKIGRFIGESIWGEDATEAYEKYGEGIPGLVNAGIDVYKQHQENKETEERGQRIEQEGIERSKQSLEGTKVAQDAELRQKAIDKISVELKDAQEQKVKMEEQLKAVEEKGFFEREWGEMDTAKENIETADYRIQVAQNRLAELQRLDKGESSGDKTDAGGTDVQLKDGGIVTQPVKALVGEAGPEAVIPLKDAGQSSVSAAQNGVLPLRDMFNSANSGTINNDILNKIASNTDNTSSGLKTLSEAILRLATVFDKKMTNLAGKSSVIINGAGGQSKEPTPASMVAANNDDPIRKVRMQFSY